MYNHSFEKEKRNETFGGACSATKGLFTLDVIQYDHIWCTMTIKAMQKKEGHVSDAFIVECSAR